MPLLSDTAVTLLRILPGKTKGKGQELRELVFGEGRAGFAGWSKAKAALDERIAKARAKAAGREQLNAEKDLLLGWHLHDIRRTVVTHMAELGVQPHVIEAGVNHVSGHKAGVAGVYDRASHAAEKRAALQSWANHLETFVLR